MYYFTAGYIHGDNNFVIQNVHNTKRKNKYYTAICILKNLLQRGNPTLMSQYLLQELKEFSMNKPEEYCHLIDNTIPLWSKVIKGDDINGYYPAKEFLYEVLPKYLSKYKFIQNLIIPEASINAITGVEAKAFVNQQVDFYLPQGKLVIEIDGQQHKLNDTNRINDGYRDKHLDTFGIKTIRITTDEIKRKNSKLEYKLKFIENRLTEYNHELINYEKKYNDLKISESNSYYKASAIIRFQLLILLLLEKNLLSLQDKEWNINVLERDISGFEEISIEDIFLWLHHICKLLKLPFNKPKVNISCLSPQEFKYRPEYINIDFSLFRRWTDDNSINPNTIYVRNDYFQDKNYFTMSVSDPVNYKIINDGEDSDEPSLKFFLKNIFGFDDFQTGQLPIILNALRGNDTIGLLPTGGGKSLCYQFVCLLQPCINFVVCPIKSLMYDQKDNMDRKFINNTNYITSDLTSETKKTISMEFSKGRYFLLWISPERFQSKEFRDELNLLNKEKTIAFAVIDEVHCLSEWGHDFRTSYLNLSKTIRKYCPSTRFIGLTATASINVLKDIMVEFNVERINVKTPLSYTRKELTFQVIKDEGANKKDKEQNLYLLLDKLQRKKDVFTLNEDKTQSGLIFTPFKNGAKGCFKLAAALSNKYKTKVKWYSGEVPEETTYENGKKKDSFPVMEKSIFDKYKMEVQDEFKNNGFPLMVATKAFGMGIDKGNIRYTIHYGIPNSLEGLYQEAGRAGRDKHNAACYVLYSKEILESQLIDKIFKLDTSIEDIQEIQKNNQKDGRDLLGNLFLWLSNNKGVDFEVKLAKKIIDVYAEPGKVKLVECKKLGYYLADVQKAIYKLTLMGIVEDWTVEKWDKSSGILEVVFESYSENHVLERLQEYIHKYDPKFTLKAVSGSESNYKKYIDIYNRQDVNLLERVLTIVIEWGYDNIVYQRRQSIKNVIDLCDNFKSPDEFKRAIENYFKFTESTYVLEHISQYPHEYMRWFEVFYEKENKLISKEALEEIKANLSRFLESYRYNTGLNYISGVVRLLLNDFDNIDGRDRLASALNDIKGFSEKDKKEILALTIEIGKKGSKGAKDNMGNILTEYFPEGAITIYKGLQDLSSLSVIIGSSIERVKKIGERLS